MQNPRLHAGQLGIQLVLPLSIGIERYGPAPREYEWVAFDPWLRLDHFKGHGWQLQSTGRTLLAAIVSQVSNDYFISACSPLAKPVFVTVTLYLPMGTESK